MKTIVEEGPWRVTTRLNKAGNLTLEVELDGEMHAELVLQEKGVVDLGTRAAKWPLGERGWDMPGAPSGFRKFRFGP